MDESPKKDAPERHPPRHIVPDGPAFMTEASFASWRDSFDMLLAMLRDAVDRPAPNAQNLSEQWREFRALRERGPAGRTLAECAALNCRKLPANIRSAARHLPTTTLELYDVVDDAEPGVLLRRLHDDATFVCHAIESGAGVFAGEIYALRLVDTGRFLAATLPAHVPGSASTQLAARLEQEYASRSSSWTWRIYLQTHGSRLILEELGEPRRATMSATDTDADPLTSPAETDVPRHAWKRLARWYSRVSTLLSDSRLTRYELPSGRVGDIYGSSECPVFELRDSGDGGGFWRVWSSAREDAFPEDAIWFDDDRVVLAARQDADRVWHDITTADVERLIGAMRWVAVHSAIDASKAA